jgi:uncharacterized protein DUF3999
MTVWLVALLAAVAQASPPTAPPAARYERPIVVTSPGPNRLAIDATLLAGAAPFTVARRGVVDPVFVARDGLADLRLAGPDGREVPYLLVYPPIDEPRWLRATVQPLASTRKTSGFEADLGGAFVVNGIEVSGLPGSFMKRFSLEGSGDREHWTLLIAQGTLFNLPDQQLRQTIASFAPGSYRYLRVTWDDTHSGKVPLPRSVSSRQATRAAAPSPLLIPLHVEGRPSEPGRSRYHLVLPAAHLPIVAIQLDVAGAHLFRQATLTEAQLSAWRAEPITIGQGLLARDQRTGSSSAPLRIVVQQPTQGELDLLVEDGSNPPLDLRAVSAELAVLPWIYFESAGPILARYGDPLLKRPVYDLEAARASVRLAQVPEARWGPSAAPAIAPAPAPLTDATRIGAPLEASGFRYSRAIGDSTADLLALTLDAGALAHSAGPARQFGDVRIVDGLGRQVPWLIERRPEPLPMRLDAQLAKAEAPELQSGAHGTRSVYRIALPYPDLPDATLVVHTTARLFRRNVTLGFERPADRRHREPWFAPVAIQSWEHVDQSAAAPALSLPVPRSDAHETTLVVDEGDNSALPIDSVQLLLPSYRLRFFRTTSSARLIYGREDLAPPTYDLALLAARVLGAAATDVTMAAEGTAGTTDGSRLLSPVTFWVILGVAVVMLLGVLTTLLRRA